MHHDRMKRLVVRALAHGAERLSQSRFRWDIAGGCQAPAVRELHVRPADERDPNDVKLAQFLEELRKQFPNAEVTKDTKDVDARQQRSKYIVVKPGTQFPLTLEMHLRCRKCDHCLKQRQRMWTARAKVEVSLAKRTWFGTLTLSPQSHAVMAARAQVRLARNGASFEQLPFGEQFLERHKECSKELTDYMKRVRDQSGYPKIRYLIVAEHHKTGLPHYHMLVHEHDTLGLRHKVLASQWKLGFEKWKLATPEDVRSVTYLCKYLSKASVARVRASRAYGTPVGIAVENSVKTTPQNTANNAAAEGMPRLVLPEVIGAF